MGSFAGRRAGRGESVTTEEAQLKVEELVRRYFAGATVRWCETNQVKPPYPFVALKLTDVSHFLHPDESGETEISQRYYCTGRIALNLYTGGRKGTGKPGMSAPPSRNTAVSDLQRFIRYLGSDAGQDFLEEHDICLQEEGSTLDVSALLNDAKYEYRAMQEFSISFVDDVYGRSSATPPAGQDSTVPTPSGGGTIDQAADTSGWFESAEVNYSKEAQA